MASYKPDTVYIVFPGLRPNPDDSEEWFSVKPFKESLAKLGYKCDLICFDDYTMEEFQELPAPAAVIFNHVVTFYIAHKYAALFELIKTWDTVFLNSVDAQFNTSNKLIMYNILQKNGIDIPKTASIDGSLVLSETECVESMESLGLNYPVVIKPPHGFKGRSTFLCNDYNSIVEAVDNVRKTRFFFSRAYNTTLKSPAIIQEYINEYPDMFIRVCVMPGYIGGYISLVSPYEEEKFVNYNKHKFRVYYKLEPELERIIRKSMSVLNVTAASCDVLLSKDGYKVTDINCFGNIAISVILSGENLFDKMTAYLDEKIKERL